MNAYQRTLGTLAGVLLLVAGAGCERKLSQEALAAGEAAKAAEARVAALEQQLVELQAAKPPSPKVDTATADQVSKSQAKALARQLADAKKSAEAKRKSAEVLAAAPAAPASVAPGPVAPVAPSPVVVEVPEGTPVVVKLAKELTTALVQPGDGWTGTLTDAVVVGGRTIWKAGTEVRGVVTQSIPAGRLSSGQGSLGIKVTGLGPDEIDTAAYVVVGDKRGARNAKFIGGAAAVGALIGLLSDDKNKGDHALGGAAIGAAAGTAAAAATAETVIKLPAEPAITFNLAAAEKIVVKP